MNKKILFLILLTALFLPVVALGALAGMCAGQTIECIVSRVANQIFLAGTWIVVICWVITGFLFLAAQGDATGLNKAKIALFTSIAGTILIVLADGARVLITTSFGL